MDFEVGDNVVFRDSYYLPNGDNVGRLEGKIIWVKEDIVGVEFNKELDWFHSCDGRGKEKHCCWLCKTSIEKIKEEKEKRMRTEKILKLAKEREFERAECDCDLQIESIIDKDEKVIEFNKRLIALKEFADKEYDDKQPLYITRGRSCLDRECFLSKESKRRISSIGEERRDRIAKIHSRYKEIEARLEACETYDQEMSVLVAYKIIDVDELGNYGKIIA